MLCLEIFYHFQRKVLKQTAFYVVFNVKIAV